VAPDLDTVLGYQLFHKVDEWSSEWSHHLNCTAHHNTIIKGLLTFFVGGCFRRMFGIHDAMPTGTRSDIRSSSVWYPAMLLPVKLLHFHSRYHHRDTLKHGKTWFRGLEHWRPTCFLLAF